MNLNIGDTYAIKLVGSTATNGYEQIETFINIPNTIFQILDVDTTYTAHTGTDPDYLTKLYSDACGWVNDPNDVTAPAYRECAGTGKDGGDITVTYQVLIIATAPSSGNVLNTLIYDFSGSSYHYNNDYSTSSRIVDIIDPNACSQSTIAEWTFASSTTTASTDNAAGTPSITAANVTGPNFLQGGNPNPGIAYSDWPNAIDTTKYVQFNVSTQGYYNVHASYNAAENNTNGPDSLNFYYSPDGTTFTQDGGTEALTTSFASSSHDLESISSLDDNASAAFRFIGFAATQTTRFLQLDNASFTGCKLPATLNLAKSGSPAAYAAAGETITYTYTLTNAGSVSLISPYDIDDDLIPDADISCAGAASPLAAGASTTCTGTYTITAADITAGSVTNTATADASTVIGDPVTSNQASETVNLADLSILKQVSASASGPWSDSVTVNVGATVYFQITVDNTGTADLTGLVVDDGIAACTLSSPSGDSDTDNVLDADETWVYTCSLTAIAGTNTNTATADSNETALESDGAQYLGSAPSFTIAKAANVPSVDQAGDVIVYTVTLTNTGNVALTGVSVSDPLLADLDCDGTPGAPFVTSGLTIAVSGTLTCSGSYTVTQADLNNNGGGDGDIDNTVTGDTDQTGSQTDSESVSIILDPELTLTKTALPLTYTAAGEVIGYSFLIENTGNVTISGPFTVSDDKATDESCPALPASLAPGDTVTCTASYTITAGDVAAGSVTNSAFATGTFGGNPVTSNTDSETVTFADITPTVTLTKTANDNSVPETGQNVTFTFTVTNTGTQSATITALSDSVFGVLAGDADCQVTTVLAASAFCSFDVSQNISGDFPGSHTNTGSATITDGDGDTASDTDPETVTFEDVLPDVSLTKSANDTSVPETGQSVTFTFTVTNNSLESATITALSDSVFGVLSGDADCQIGTVLGSGASCNFTLAQTISGDFPGSHTNTGSVTVSDGDGNSDTATDPEAVAFEDVLPTISVDKNASPTSVSEPGGNVTFSVDVYNTGAEAVSLTALTDDVYGDLNGQGTCAVPQTILAGSSYSCSFTGAVAGNAGDSQTDIVTAEAEDDEANTASDADDATVTVLD
ncbi:MAG: beta strand repeat-containing protein, partial [Gammaproteobacteria bacterium]